MKILPSNYLERRGFLKRGIWLTTGILTLSLLPACTSKQLKQIIEALSELSQLINNYRNQNGLAKIPISDKLTAVALKHILDLNKYHPEQSCGSSGNVHSWSKHGNWSGKNGAGNFKGCCYPDDHSNKTCMWDKPKEIAGYSTNGFEIAHWTSGTVSAASALASWKGSKAHNDVILNKGAWSNFTWNALGAMQSGNYACAWFGTAKK